MNDQKEREAKLAKEWDRLMDSCNVPRNDVRGGTFATLVAAYSEPHRHWHNLDHIDSLLAHLSLPRHRLKEALASLELAVWFHDVVYDPLSSENESRSAEVARASLSALGFSAERIARVCELILMTKDHEAPIEDKTAQFFLDADMSILGTNPVLYPEYATDIRKEYACVPDRDYYQGRRQVLLGFLQRPTIFRTDWFKQWEASARRNIAAEIAQIDATLRTLPP